MPCHGSYFITADFRPLGFDGNDEDFGHLSSTCSTSISVLGNVDFPWDQVTFREVGKRLSKTLRFQSEFQDFLAESAEND